MAFVSVYFNEWNEAAWFAAILIPNAIFEGWFVLNKYKDMPDIFVTIG